MEPVSLVSKNNYYFCLCSRGVYASSFFYYNAFSYYYIGCAALWMKISVFQFSLLFLYSFIFSGTYALIRHILFVVPQLKDVSCLLLREWFLYYKSYKVHSCMYFDLIIIIFNLQFFTYTAFYNFCNGLFRKCWMLVNAWNGNWNFLPSPHPSIWLD